MGMNSTKYGGIEKFNVELAKQGLAKGMDFIFVYNSIPATQTYIDDLKQYNASVIEIKNTSLFHYIKRCISLIASEKPSVIHFHFGNEQLILSPIVKVLYPRIVQICTQHSEFLTKKSILIFQKKLEYCCVKKVLAVSKGVKKGLEQKLGKNPKIEVSYLGVKQPTAIADPQLKKEFGIPDDCIVLSAIGFDINIKGYDILAQSVKLLSNNSTLPNFRILIIGLSEEEDKKFSHLIQDLGIARYFISTGIRNDVDRFLAISDIYLQPSRTEGLPLSIMEALQYGLPIIGSNIGGIPEAIHHEENGFLAEPCDYQDLAQRLKQLISNEKLRLKFGKQSKLLAPTFRNEEGAAFVLNTYSGFNH